MTDRENQLFTIRLIYKSLPHKEHGANRQQFHAIVQLFDQVNAITKAENPRWKTPRPINPNGRCIGACYGRAWEQIKNFIQAHAQEYQAIDSQLQ